jgi:hypothetical protein
MAIVHSYKRWDTTRDRYVTTRLKGTPAYIATIQGEIMLHTEQEVSPRDLDKQGRYDPEARNAQIRFDRQVLDRVGGMRDGGFGSRNPPA